MNSRFYNKSALQKAKKHIKDLPDISPMQTNRSYKTRMFSNTGYKLTDIQNWLPAFIVQLPEQQRSLFKRAGQLLQQPLAEAEKIPPLLSQEQAFHSFYNYIRDTKPVELNQE